MRDKDALFTVVGAQPLKQLSNPPKKTVPVGLLLSLTVLSILILGCLFAGVIAPNDPSYLNLDHFSHAPDGAFLFGTDTLGRDIFACIWHGGRISLFIGFGAAGISTVIAVVYGALSGLAPLWADAVLMRLVELLLSIPSLLMVLFLQAIFGSANVFTITLVIGVTGWCAMAKVVRTEVRQLRSCEYVTASKAMGGGFFHILTKHLAPNFWPSIMYMSVMSVRSAIAAESTLSFMGMGLPLEIVSWGSMLSLAEKAMMTHAWWMILIPGGFLAALLMSLTDVGNHLRRQGSRRGSNL